MKNLQNYQGCSKAELTEMLDEAKRAQRIVEANQEAEMNVESIFKISEAAILTVHTETNRDFVLLELTEIIDLLETELKKR